MLPLKLISSMACRDVLLELASTFEAAGGQPVRVEAVGGVDAAKRVRAGEVVDVVVLARNSIDALAQEGLVRTGTTTDIAQSGIAVAVRADGRVPDLSDETAVRVAVAAAPSIGYSTGPSGTYLESKFRSWGILDEIRPRILVAPPGVPVGRLVSEGKVALGFQQLSELINLAGITLAGSLPPEMQLITIFSGVVACSSTDKQAADALLRYLASAESSALKLRFGMQAVPAG